MRLLTRHVVVAAAVMLGGCKDNSPIQPNRPSPDAVIFDGTNSDLGAVIFDGANSNGNPDFFFLPPLVANPVGSPFFDAGKFNPALSPFVEVCVLAGSPLLNPNVACRDSDGDGRPDLVFGPTQMSLDASNQQYQVNWNTKSVMLDLRSFYRIIVRGSAQGTALGFLDVDPVLGGMKNVKTGDVVVFQDGLTLPIKVRIELGAFGSSNSADRVEQVVPNVIPGGFLDVTTNTGFAGARFTNGWLPLGIDQVVVIIERVGVNNGARATSCLDTGLEELEGCYRFRTDPDLHGLGPEGTDVLFALPVIAGVCFQFPEDIGHDNEHPFQLHRREELARQLIGPPQSLKEVPAPFLRCDGFTATPPSIGEAFRSGRLGDIAKAGWSAVTRTIGRALQPKALYAVDAGAGGSTNEFSRFGFARPASMTVTAGDRAIVPAGSTVPASVRIQNSHHDEWSPVVGQSVTFTVTAGGGTLTSGETCVEASTCTVTSDAEGDAAVSWRLGLGANTVQVSTAYVTNSTQTITATGAPSTGTISVVP